MRDLLPEDVIASRAEQFAKTLNQIAETASNEEEIRIATEKQLAFLEKATNVKLTGKHEFTVASGRVDSVYDRVLIEYKNPSSASARIGTSGTAAGTRAVVRQIQSRFADLEEEYGHPIKTLLGVGLDGRRIVFVRCRQNEWEIGEPLPLDKNSASRFIWALLNLGRKGRPFSPDFLATDFGASSQVAKNGVRALYKTLTTSKSPHMSVLFDQWRILFSEVCGSDIDAPTDRMRRLAAQYEIPVDEQLQSAALLFALHTYYAIFMKLLAAEIVAFHHRLPTPLRKMTDAGSSEKLRREVEDLESGSIFRHLGITNFLEGDLFAWYSSEWSEDIERLIRELVAALEEYNPGTLSEDPARSRDLLKKLYQDLMPRDLRHDLGEYYTPDWLAQHVLDEVGFDGDPRKRILDPACGSGTFLVMTINRVRQWLDAHREDSGLDERQISELVLSNVVGFDLNPLAVMAARTNFLIAIRDLIGYSTSIEIPVYLCDSVLTPSEYGDLFSGGTLGKARSFSTAVGKFVVPGEVSANRERISKYAEIAESCVDNGYSTAEFLERCSDEGLLTSERELHEMLYEKLVELNSANRNGVWARIIKNAFAPLFVSAFDFVVGNPPWINWESLPEGYRKDSAELWTSYDLFQEKGYKAKLGGAKDDLSVLFSYVCHDRYLKDTGRLGFVITQSLFKTRGGGAGFRRFAYGSAGNRRYFNPLRVHDFSALQPFEGATNRTATFTAGKGTRPVKYPVRYLTWRKKAKGRLSQEMSLDEVVGVTTRERLAAKPVRSSEPASPWLTVPEKALPAVERVLGSSAYVGREGVNTGGLNGCFWIEILQTLSDGSLLIRNLNDVGKKKVPSIEAAIEPDLVYPLIRGRDVSRWLARPSANLILGNRTDKLAGIPETEMKKRWPKTFAYLKTFEKQLRSRSGFKRFFKPTDPFYSMFNVGPYTVAPFKVVWPEVGNTVEAAVISTDGDLNKPSLPTHTVVAVDCRSAEEAHFVCGLLNSAPAQATVQGYIVLHPSPHVLTYLNVPDYDGKNCTHSLLSRAAQACQSAVERADVAGLARNEKRVNELACEIWHIPLVELDQLTAIEQGN